MSYSDLRGHWEKQTYGSFRLTDAIRPSLDLAILPQQGYRKEQFEDAKHSLKTGALTIAVSAERLFDLFLDLLEPLGEMVNVVMESSHDLEGGEQVDWAREHVDLPVLMSHMCDYEDLLMNDGCSGIAVLGLEEMLEVQFDEHKLLYVYAEDLEPFERILQEHGIARNDNLPLLTEAEHLHSTDERHRDAFEQLCYRLGVLEPTEWATFEDF